MNEVGRKHELSEQEIQRRLRQANPLNDVLFKYLFASDENKENLLRLLNDVLGPKRRIVDVDYLDRESDPNRLAGKLSSLDVLARSDDGRICHVEVQLSDEGNFVERVVYYAACSLEDQLSVAQDYSELRPVIFVSLLRFSLFRDKPESWHATQRLLDVENHKCYTDCLEFHFLELPKLARMRRNIEETSLVRLLCYLGRMGGVREMERLAEQDPGIARLRKGERSFFRTPGNLALYMKRERAETDYQNALRRREEKGRAEGEARGEARGREEGLSLGLAKGEAKGRAEGQHQERLSLARKLLASGMTRTQVAELTELAPEELPAG